MILSYNYVEEMLADIDKTSPHWHLARRPTSA